MSNSRLSWLLLLAGVLVTESSPVRDDPYTDKVQKVISQLNSWLEDHVLTKAYLPDLGQFFFEPIHLRNGVLGNFNTLQLQGTPQVEESPNQDNTTTFTFTVDVGLKEFFVQYKYQMDLFGYQTTGVMILSPLENVLELTGIVVEGGKYCDARLDGFRISKLGEYKIEVQSDDETTHITEILKAYISPFILSVINSGFNGIRYTPNLQSKFSELVCKELAA